ncbi:MAG: hypothetical protein WCX64_00230 [Candidatus Micrarchaeia archaeon]
MAERSRRIERSRRDDKPAKGNGKLLLVLCIFAIIAYLFLSGAVKLPSIGQPGASQSASTPNMDMLNKSLGIRLLEYTHPTFGFKVSYPAGYALSSNSLDAGVLQLYALGSANVPIVIDLTLTNSSLGKKDYYALVESIPNEDDMKAYNIWNGSAKFGGNNYYVINYTQSSSLVADDLFLTYAFINCRDYGIMVEGIVPVKEKTEQIVVNSVLESFVCG